MSGILQQTAGIARSLFIYYIIPGRAARRRQFYRTVIKPGDLCFDIGAHVGNHTRDLLAIGGRVVAVEPQPALMKLLRWLYGSRQNATLRQVAVGAARGHARLMTSRRNPTVATLSHDWVKTVQQAQGFRPVAWEGSIEVEVVTLDDLIAQYGVPTFCKLDIEGYEAAALLGLSVALPLVTFEFIPAAQEEAVACVQRLMELGRYVFNWSVGERLHLQEPVWVDDIHIVQRLQGFDINDRSGDIYARLMT
jgi:FkbM family methyltransferase